MCAADTFMKPRLINEITKKTDTTVNLTKQSQKTIINLLKRSSAAHRNSGEGDAMQNDQRYF
jgi:DNA phosphorothioation-dependent restriction protein DptG